MMMHSLYFAAVLTVFSAVLVVGTVPAEDTVATREFSGTHSAHPSTGVSNVAAAQQPSTGTSSVAPVLDLLPDPGGYAAQDVEARGPSLSSTEKALLGESWTPTSPAATWTLPEHTQMPPADTQAPSEQAMSHVKVLLGMGPDGWNGATSGNAVPGTGSGGTNSAVSGGSSLKPPQAMAIGGLAPGLAAGVVVATGSPQGVATGLLGGGATLGPEVVAAGDGSTVGPQVVAALQTSGPGAVAGQAVQNNQPMLGSIGQAAAGGVTHAYNKTINAALAGYNGTGGVTNLDAALNQSVQGIAAGNYTNTQAAIEAALNASMASGLAGNLTTALGILGVAGNESQVLDGQTQQEVQQTLVLLNLMYQTYVGQLATLGCILDVQKDIRVTYGATSDTLPVLARCAQKGLLSQRLCSRQEIVLFLRSVGPAPVIASNANCNASSHLAGCAPGFASFMTTMPTAYDMAASPTVPQRTDQDSTQAALACCDGFFCPENLACMIPCPHGSYCLQAMPWQLAYTICLPYGYRASGGNVCGGADMWGISNTQNAIFCPAGNYCPSVGQRPVECPKGHFCKTGLDEPTKCSPFTHCSAGRKVQNLRFFSSVLVGTLLVVAAIVYKTTNHLLRRGFAQLQPTPAMLEQGIRSGVHLVITTIQIASALPVLVKQGLTAAATAPPATLPAQFTGRPHDGRHHRPSIIRRWASLSSLHSATSMHRRIGEGSHLERVSPDASASLCGSPRTSVSSQPLLTTSSSSTCLLALSPFVLHGSMVAGEHLHPSAASLQALVSAATAPSAEDTSRLVKADQLGSGGRRSPDRPWEGEHCCESFLTSRPGPGARIIAAPGVLLRHRKSWNGVELPRRPSMLVEDLDEAGRSRDSYGCRWPGRESTDSWVQHTGIPVASLRPVVVMGPEDEMDDVCVSDLETARGQGSEKSPNAKSVVIGDVGRPAVTHWDGKPAIGKGGGKLAAQLDGKPAVQHDTGNEGAPVILKGEPILLSTDSPRSPAVHSPKKRDRSDGGRKGSKASEGGASGWIKRTRKLFRARTRGQPPIDVEFEDLFLTLRGSGKKLLKGITGKLHPGRVTAIMGPSGVGKTCILNVLAGKLTYTKMTGTMKINGRPASLTAFRKIVGFVPQDDVVHPNLTVEEALWFAANFRLPHSMNTMERALVVEKVILSLGLVSVRDALVGSVEHRGISGGQRKRVNVGLEMVALPSLLLLDEPTSGLDSSSSMKVLEALRQEAEQGVNVAAVLHQPSYKLFCMFDDVAFVNQGQLAYMGPVAKVEAYFDSLGFALPPRTNPPDHYISVLVGGEKSATGIHSDALCDMWRQACKSGFNEEKDWDLAGMLKCSSAFRTPTRDSLRASGKWRGRQRSRSEVGDVTSAPLEPPLEAALGTRFEDSAPRCSSDLRFRVSTSSTASEDGLCRKSSSLDDVHLAGLDGVGPSALPPTFSDLDVSDASSEAPCKRPEAQDGPVRSACHTFCATPSPVSSSRNIDAGTAHRSDPGTPPGDGNGTSFDRRLGEGSSLDKVQMAARHVLEMWAALKRLPRRVASWFKRRTLMTLEAGADVLGLAWLVVASVLSLEGENRSGRQTPGFLRQLEMILYRTVQQRLREPKIWLQDYLTMAIAGSSLGMLVTLDDRYMGGENQETVLCVSLLIMLASLRTFGLDKLHFFRESSAGINKAAYFLAKDTCDHIHTALKSFVYLGLFYFFQSLRSTFLDNYLVTLALAYCCTGIGYVAAITLKPASAQLGVAMLNLVALLFAISASAGSLTGWLHGAVYTKWAMEGFLLANAKRYSGVWLLTRCAILRQFQWALKDYSHCIYVLLGYGVCARVVAFACLVICNHDKQK